MQLKIFLNIKLQYLKIKNKRRKGKEKVKIKRLIYNLLQKKKKELIKIKRIKVKM